MISDETIPSTMKAAKVHKVGGGHDVANPEQITVEEGVPVPEPAKGEVLIQVAAAAINPVDWKLLGGLFPGKKAGEGFGLDVSGTVVKLGPDVKSLKAGDEVYADVIQTASKSGSMAEYCICQEVAAHVKPKNTSMEEAASLSLVGLTALQGLTTHGGIQTGHKVLIFGGTSGVGSLAVQMAKAMGASEVYATGSSVDKIKSLGADHVINYKDHSLMEELKGKDFDVVYDTIGGYEHWEVGHAALKKKGTFVTIAGDPGSFGLPGMVVKVLWRKFVSYFGQPTYKIFLTDSTPPAVVENMKKITELVEGGKVKPVLDGKTYTLTNESLHDMIKDSMSNRSKGKLIMKIN
jgi:NADPH:quinone reductase-like Zn-dependent oxidoreductase